MIWNLVLMVVHLSAFACLLLLYPAAPCWMQKLVVGMLAVAMLIFGVAYGVALVSGWHHWQVTRVALQFEHYAVLLYVFRLVYQGQQWTPSAHSPHSPG